MPFTPRAAWADAPAPLHAAVADALGTPIADHTDLHGGWSPGPAAALRLADGRTVFVKAMSAEVRTHNHRLVRRESAILDVLPESVPAPPPLNSPVPTGRRLRHETSSYRRPPPR